MSDFEKWFDLWDATHDPEVRRLCGIAWRAALAEKPAEPDWKARAERLADEVIRLKAERPQLSAEQVRAIRDMESSWRNHSSKLAADISREIMGWADEWNVEKGSVQEIIERGFAAIRREAERAAFGKAALEVEYFRYQLEDGKTAFDTFERDVNCILEEAAAAIRALADSPVSGQGEKKDF